MSKKNIISISVLGVAFLISLGLFVFNGNRYSKLSFKFYHELKHNIVIEDRYVMLKGSRDNRAETIVEELFLGPMSVLNHKIVPFDMKYNFFYINDRVAYLDMPLKFVSGFNETYYTIDDAIVLIKDNLLKNIQGINRVIITIDGETMGAGPSKNLLPQGE